MSEQIETGTPEPVQPALIDADPSIADIEAYRKGPDPEPEPVETEAKPEPEADPASEAGKALAGKKKSLQARIDELVAQTGSTQRERDALAQKAAALEAELTALKAPKAPATATAKPKVEDFGTYEEYVEALTDWKVETREATKAQEADEARRKAWEQQQAQAASETAKGWIDRRDAFAATSPEFAEKANPFLAQLYPNTPMGDVIMESPVGPQLALYLAEHLDEANRIASLHPRAQLLALGKLEAKLEAPVEVEKPVVVTKAPAPVRPISGAPAGTAPDPAEMSSVTEWRKHRGQFGG